MKFKSLFTATALAACTALTPVAQASYVTVFGDITFTLEVVDANSVSLQVENALSTTTTNWAPATLLSAFSLKNVGDLVFSGGGASTATATYLDGLTNPAAVGLNNELNASATCGGPGGGPNVICFNFSPNAALTDDMLIQIDFSNVHGLDDTDAPHLKMAVADGPTGKVGDLISQDMTFTASSSSSSSSTSSSGLASSSGDIPEPSSSGLALLGLGLVGASFALRRKTAQR